MKAQIDSLKKTFREGRHAEAVAACEALCEQAPAEVEPRKLGAAMHAMLRNHARSLTLLQGALALAPDDADVLFNLAMCERELKDFAAAAAHFERYVARHPGHPDGWAGLAECRQRTGAFAEGLAAADRALRLDADCVPALTARGLCQQALGQAGAALQSLGRAIQLAPQEAQLLAARGELLEALGRMDGAAADYAAALALAPDDGPLLKKATLCLLQQDKGQEAIALCRRVLQARPDSLTAKLGAEWLLSQMVPLWHVPMMNEEERNRPYFDALKAAVTPEKTVFEIGTGSGLLAMMAASLGARRVVTCEAVGLVAETARAIVARNRLQDKVTVLAKPSYAVQVGQELPERADILVHEIFSSELLGEHVLPAIEDAKARLLKPGGTLLPGVASLMIALVGGEELGKELHVDSAFGFDLGPFNAIHPKKRPVYREDLPRELLSADVEAFRFDFAGQDSFPAQSRRIEMTALRPGRCWGVIQWIRFEFGDGIFFENHPGRPRPVASWQHTIYRFDAPLQLEAGTVVAVNAMHDRSRPWFEKAP